MISQAAAFLIIVSAANPAAIVFRDRKSPYDLLPLTKNVSLENLYNSDDLASFTMKRSGRMQAVGRFRLLDGKVQTQTQDFSENVDDVFAISKDLSAIVASEGEKLLYFHRVRGVWKKITLPPVASDTASAEIDVKKHLICIVSSFRAGVNTNRAVVDIYRLSGSRVKNIGRFDDGSDEGVLTMSHGWELFDDFGSGHKIVERGNRVRFSRFSWDGQIITPIYGNDYCVYGRDAEYRVRGKIISGNGPENTGLGSYWKQNGIVFIQYNTGQVFVNSTPLSYPGVTERTYVFFAS